jgi:hypothetical protein
MSGENWEIKSSVSDGVTTFDYYFDGCESVALKLTPGSASPNAKTQVVLRKDFVQISDVS